MNSMTGFGKNTLERDGREITIELKSVNHRFLDLSFRMPHALLFAEDDMRRAIADKLSRGHVDVYASYRNKRPDARSVEIDISLARAYRDALDTLRGEGIQCELTLHDILSIGDIVTVREAADDEGAVRALVLECLEGSLSALSDMRSAEGKRLAQDLGTCLDQMSDLTARIEKRRPEMMAQYEARLEKAVAELAKDRIDPARMSLEIALMADRSAIEEETVRLRSHIEQGRAILSGTGPVGRKLDFLAQELNREANTISSKSQDIPITDAVMSLKNTIEKFREQVQNAE